MAKRKGGKRRRRAGTKRRRNPANPSRRRRASPRRHTRRRRNPAAGGFVDRLTHLAGGALAAVGTGVLVIYGQSKLQPAPVAGATTPATPSNLVLYGVPLAAFLAGTALAGKIPTLGAGVALGAFSPFALPLASKMLAASTATTATTTTTTQPAATTAAGLGRAFRSMRAVSMGSAGGYDPYDMGAVDMRAVDYRR